MRVRALAGSAFAVASVFLAPGAAAEQPLFPTPLHITRQISEPFSGKTVVIQEYGYGNRLISVRGSVTAIADYEKGELTEIDREGGTYSVTRFDIIAKASKALAAPPAAALKVKELRLRTAGARTTKGGRLAEFFSAEIGGKESKQAFEVGIDRSVTLSREALEVVIGAAYPGTRNSEHEVLLSAAGGGRLTPISQGSSSASRPTYALPVEQVTRYEVEGEALEFRNTVMRIGSEPPSADLLAIPGGARLVESRIAAVHRELELAERQNEPPPKP
jgi:hypothetical protein